MKSIRVIGDSHQEDRKYLQIVKSCQYSICVGDVGFNYNFLNTLDPANHKINGGNHENYDIIEACPHYLGDFGVCELNGIRFFFVRGEFSIDWQWRVKNYYMGGGLSWWKQEELSAEQMAKCLELYKEVKPDFVISHGWPDCVAKLFGNPGILKDFGFDPDTFTTNTQQLLQAMFDYHQPKLWIGGHLHLYNQIELNGTIFICLPILGYMDVFENLTVSGLMKPRKV
jgi:hypothetical protein